VRASNPREKEIPRGFFKFIFCCRQNVRRGDIVLGEDFAFNGRLSPGGSTRLNSKHKAQSIVRRIFDFDKPICDAATRVAI
jgi:hypothetical protein